MATTIAYSSELTYWMYTVTDKVNSSLSITGHAYARMIGWVWGTADQAHRLVININNVPKLPET